MSDFGLGIIIAGAIGIKSTSGKQGGGSSRSIGPIIANITEEERHQDDLEITDHPVERGATISDHAFKRPAEVILRCGWTNSMPAPSSNSILGGIASALINKAAGAVQTGVVNAAQKVIGGSALGNLAVAKLSNLAGDGLSSLTSRVNPGSGKGTTVVQDVYQQLLKLQASAVPFKIYTGKRMYSNMLIRSIVVTTDKKSENSLEALITCREVITVQTTVTSVGADPANQKAPEATAPVTDAGSKQATPVDAASNPQVQKQLQKNWSKS